MSFVQPFLRGRVLVKRVASVCGMIVVLPLMGCGSQDSVFESGYAGRDARLAGPVQGGKSPRPVLASSGSASAYAPSGGTMAAEGVAVAYATVPTSANYVAGGVQRSSLAPLADPAKPAGEPASYALGAVDYESAPRAGKSGAVREAANYGRKQPQPQPYAGDDSDYREADQARQSDYAPEPRAGRAASVKPEPQGGGRGGEYVVRPGDTLYGISQRNGLSLDELATINGLRSHEIYVGQRLRVEGEPQGPQGRAYGAARPEPRGYREPVQERSVQERPVQERGQAYRQPTEPREAYRSQGEEPRGSRSTPSVNVYEQRQGARYVEPEHQQSRSYESPYAQERPSRETGRAYREPQGDDGRPEYTSSNSRYTPDGPFEPTPDAPWRGETEWRRMRQQDGRAPAYEPQPEPRYESRRGAPAEAYDGRPPYQAQPAERTPYGGRGEREAAREPYSAPSRGGPAGGGPAGAYAYTVQRGDTLYEIARRSGLDQRELAAFNGLPPDARLTAGQDLRIPQGRGYDWSRPRPETAVQPSAPRQPASAQTAPAQLGRAPAKVTAAPEQAPKPPHQPGTRPQRSSKIITDQLPQRLGAKPAAPQVVHEDAPPAKATQAHEPQPQPRMAAAPAEPAADVPVNDAAPSGTTATATANVVAEHSGPRECETLLASPEPRSAKTFRTPVQGMVIAKFGAQNDGSFNDGINFSVPKGTPVKAAENGVVAYAGDELPGFGNLVLIRHSDGYVTAYAHNDELLVNKCDVVKRGQIISKAGASGKAISPQLHFELRRESKPMDPDGHFSGT